ncbi:MAG: uroporphyrinogen decarboxylase family protein [Candidatus Thorarchaeota archaeon]
MSKFDLLKQTFLGNVDEQIPLALWKHHPDADRSPEGLAQAEVAFHKKFDSDVMKISFFGHYPCIDFGCEAEYDGAITGSTTLTKAAIGQTSDWEVLDKPDVMEGEFGNQVRAVELIQKYAHGIVPTMATIFDGPMVADKICDKELARYMDESPEVIESALDIITDVMIDFARATLEAGADGVFIASQHSTMASVSDEHYKKFILPQDEKLISKLRGKAKFIVMHLHAREPNEVIRFDPISRTKGLDAVNWEDQTSSIDLREGKSIAKKTAFGGIDHNGIFRTGTPEEARRQVIEAIDEAGLEHLVIAPGCVITIDTPEDNIQAVKQAVRSTLTHEEK